jgi:hypothetical protein
LPWATTTSDVDGSSSFTPALRSGSVSGLINVAAGECGSVATGRSLRDGTPIVG